MYTELPLIETSTPAERLAALKDAKELMAGTPETSTGGIFGGATTKPRDFFDTAEAIRIAEYITTGHDYKDTHPAGKRRPVIKKITNVTVMAPAGSSPTEADIEHLLSHMADGSFAEFVEDMVTKANTEDADDDHRDN